MKKFYSLFMASLLFSGIAVADEYVVSSWCKSKLAADSVVSADKVLIGKKPIAESRQLRVNPYDSLVIINTSTDKTSTYVNSSDKMKVVTVKDLVRRRSLNVVISMLSETFSSRKPEQPQYKLIGAASRHELTPSTVDPEHMKIYNTLVDFIDKDNQGALTAHSDLRFYTDTVDGVIGFVVENFSKKKSYIVNVLVSDPATGKLDMAITFPEHTSSPAVVVGPYSRIALDGVGYAVREHDPLNFYLVVSQKPYDPNYLSMIMQADNIEPTRKDKSKDIVCVPLTK